MRTSPKAFWRSAGVRPRWVSSAQQSSVISPWRRASSLSLSSATVSRAPENCRIDERSLRPFEIRGQT
jgi:hypothetical protein